MSEADGTVDEYSKKRWWWAMRRCFDVPDIVQSNAAWSYLSWAAAGQPEGMKERVDYPHLVGAGAVATVLDLAESGDFDLPLLDKSVDVTQICRRKAPAGGPRSAHNAEVFELVAPLAEELCKWVANPTNRSEPPEAILLGLWS